MYPPLECGPNPAFAERTWPGAVIAGGYQTGVLAARSLARRGVRVLCVEVDPGMQAFKSTYCDARVCPNPDTDPSSWVRFMRELAAGMGEKPVLIPSADQFVSAIADHAAELTDLYVVSPGVTLQGQLAVKNAQYELAMSHGMPLPLTRTVRSKEEVTELASAATFPCVMKPFHFREWQRLPLGHPLRDEKVAIAETREALVESWAAVASFTPEVIVQELIEGPDSEKRLYIACYGRTGVRIGRAMFRETRCYPPYFGNATVTEPVVDEETDMICDSFLRSIGYVGICEIQVKRDVRDGKVKMIEANPRLSGGGAPSPVVGVDMCWLHYLDLVGVDVQPLVPHGRDFRHIVLRSDLRAIVENRRAGLLTWREALRSYRPPLDFFDLDLRDWRNAWTTVLGVARSAVGIVVRPLLDGLRSRGTLRATINDEGVNDDLR